MIGANAAEHAILALTFGYQSFDASIHVLESYGDEKSAGLLSRVRAEWKACGHVPDLSHETRFGVVTLRPKPADVVDDCTRLIDAYDAARETKNGARLNLRRTIEAHFELRAFARDFLESKASQTIQRSSHWLQEPLTLLPIASASAKKLKAAGVATLEQMRQVDDKSLSALTGLTAGQMLKVHDQVFNFLEYQFAQERRLGDERISTQIAECLQRKMKVETVDWRFWLPMAERPTPSVSWHRLVIAIENYEAFMIDLDGLIMELKKLQEMPVDWSDYPWTPVSRARAGARSKRNAQLASLENVEASERGQILDQLQEYFRDNRLKSLFDVLTHSPESFGALGKKIDREFKLGWTLKNGLPELRTNLSFMLPDHQSRVMKLLSLTCP